jgi:hypothetical protein
MERPLFDTARLQRISGEVSGMSCVTLTLVAFALAFTVALAPAARAGIADTPLPVLAAGATTLHLYSVPGVVFGGLGVATFFACTSTDVAPMQVAVETFPPVGGAPVNDAAATSLSVAPGATVIFGTSAAVGISINSSVGGCACSKGSARILATSKKLLCTAWVADTGNAPPTSAWQLNVVAKTKQKGD